MALYIPHGPIHPSWPYRPLLALYDPTMTPHDSITLPDPMTPCDPLYPHDLVILYAPLTPVPL